MDNDISTVRANITAIHDKTESRTQLISFFIIHEIDKIINLSI